VQEHTYLTSDRCMIRYQVRSGRTAMHLLLPAAPSRSFKLLLASCALGLRCLSECTCCKSLACLQLPLADLAGKFYSALKSCTSGYATFDYEEGPYREADLVRLDFLVHGSPVDALTRVLHRSSATSAGRAVCKKLVEVLSHQPFEVRVQARACGLQSHMPATNAAVSHDRL
jgi:GTP-binding protein LepA C-terminus